MSETRTTQSQLSHPFSPSPLLFSCLPSPIWTVHLPNSSYSQPYPRNNPPNPTSLFTHIPSYSGGRAQNMLPERHDARACRLLAAAARFSGATDMRRAAMFTMFISSTNAAADVSKTLYNRTSWFFHDEAANGRFVATVRWNIGEALSHHRRRTWLISGRPVTQHLSLSSLLQAQDIKTKQCTTHGRRVETK